MNRYYCLFPFFSPFSVRCNSSRKEFASKGKNLLQKERSCFSSLERILSLCWSRHHFESVLLSREAHRKFRKLPPFCKTIGRTKKRGGGVPINLSDKSCRTTLNVSNWRCIKVFLKRKKCTPICFGGSVSVFRVLKAVIHFHLPLIIIEFLLTVYLITRSTTITITSFNINSVFAVKWSLDNYHGITTINLFLYISIITITSYARPAQAGPIGYSGPPVSVLPRW